MMGINQAYQKLCSLKCMHKMRMITWVTLSLLVFCCGLFYMATFMPQYAKQIPKFSAQAEFIPHIFLAIAALIIYKNADRKNQKTLLWLAIAAIGLFLNHLVFYVLVYLRGSLITNNHFFVFVLDFIPIYYDAKSACS